MSAAYDDPFEGVPAPAGTDVLASVSPAPAPVPAPAAAVPAAPAPSPAPLSETETVIPAGGPVSDGKRAPIGPANPLPAWRSPELQDQGDGAGPGEQIDYSDLAAVNRDLAAQRIRLNRVRRQLRAASREAVEARLKYSRELRRQLVQQSGGSAEMRKAAAELACEDLEADAVMKEQVAAEYNTLFRSVRDDIENVKVIAYNLRSLMNLS